MYEKLKNKLNLSDIIRYFIIFNKGYDDVETRETIDITLKGMLSGAVMSLLNEDIKKINNCTKNFKK